MLCQSKHSSEASRTQEQQREGMCLSICQASCNLSVRKKKWLACSKADQAPTFNQKRSRCVTAKKPAIDCQEPSKKLCLRHHRITVCSLFLLRPDSASLSVRTTKRFELNCAMCSSPISSLYTACASHVYHTGAFSANVWTRKIRAPIISLRLTRFLPASCIAPPINTP